MFKRKYVSCEKTDLEFVPFIVFFVRESFVESLISANITKYLIVKVK